MPIAYSDHHFLNAIGKHTFEYILMGWWDHWTMKNFLLVTLYRYVCFQHINQCYVVLTQYYFNGFRETKKHPHKTIQFFMKRCVQSAYYWNVIAGICDGEQCIHFNLIPLIVQSTMFNKVPFWAIAIKTKVKATIEINLACAFYDVFFLLLTAQKLIGRPEEKKSEKKNTWIK